jgi:hypothetical protein
MRQPTVVANIPPKEQVVVDLFDMGSSGATQQQQQAPSQSNGWDAFGGSTGQQQQNFANFGGPPQQVPPSQQQQNFANFGAPHAMPPQQQQNFANFPAPVQPQQQNFGSFPSGPPTPPGQPKQQEQPGAGGFANFTGQQQQQLPPQNFGNFPSQPPQPQLQNVASFPPQQEKPFQQGGPPHSAQQQHPPTPPNQQPPTPTPQNQQGGFGKFAPQGGMQQQPLQHQQGGFPPQQQQQQGGFGKSTPQQPPQQHGIGVGNVPPQQQPQSVSGNAQVGVAPQQQQACVAPQQQQAVAQDKFAAFNSFHISQAEKAPATNGVTANSVASEGLGVKHPSTDAMSNLSVSSGVTKKPGPPNPRASKYAAGQKVYYKSASYVGSAEVLKVHFDDALEPFYTIKVQDKEKQTDDMHLAECGPLQAEIQKMLSGLSDDQLDQVKRYVSQLSSGNAAPIAPSLSVPSLSAAPPQQQQQIGGFGRQQQLANGSPQIQVSSPSAPQLNQPHPQQQQTGVLSMPQLKHAPAHQQPQTNMPGTQPPQQQAQPPPDMQQPTANQGFPGPAPPQMGQFFGMMPQSQMTMGGEGISAGGGGSFDGIPSPSTNDSKPGIPQQNGLPVPPLSQTAQQMQQNPMPSPPGQTQQQMQFPPPQQQQMQFPPPQQQQMPQGHVQFPPQQQQMQPQGQQQQQMQLRHGQQQPQTQFQQPPQQVQKQQAPQSPMSPKGNPFDFY